MNPDRRLDIANPETWSEVDERLFNVLMASMLGLLIFSLGFGLGALLGWLTHG